MRGYPHFSFWIPITLAKIYFFPIVVTFAKIISIRRHRPHLHTIAIFIFAIIIFIVMVVVIVTTIAVL